MISCIINVSAFVFCQKQYVTDYFFFQLLLTFLPTHSLIVLKNMLKKSLLIDIWTYLMESFAYYLNLLVLVKQRYILLNLQITIKFLSFFFFISYIAHMLFLFECGIFNTFKALLKFVKLIHLCEFRKLLF